MKQKSTFSMMVVEDDLVIGERITNEFERFINSKDIKLARTVKESFDLLDSFEFKIMVLDLSLPDGNGIAVLDKLQEDNLNVVAYVFSINSELKKLCIRKGATAFFDKSKDFNNLINTVRSSLYK
ncbi:response regulator [Yeosuana marina]|uniref:response regulator n=1 Tax=Yeosuana marina TaxID=1565536 RepID=UPI0030C819E4